MNAKESCPLPARRSMSLRQTIAALRAFRGHDWMKAAVIAVAAALIIGIPTVLIPNPLFQRMIPTTPIDYVVYGIAVVLIGLTWAMPENAEGNRHFGGEQTNGKQSIAGFVATIFAVGCPTCNVLVLWLLGTGGAMTYFAPLQPIIGMIAMTLLLFALMRRASRVDD